MSSGALELQSFIERVRKLGTLPEEVAKVAAPEVEAVVKQTAAAGRTPSGEAWRPTRDGKRALSNAADAVHARAIGSVVQLSLQDTSTGSAKVQAIQNTRRNIIPAKGEDVPAPIVQAIASAAQKTFQRMVGGR